ncbi:Methicillin resistance mecR1 protein [uncultured Flavonifractor sp.]|nr:Methicillin resistance mecR1 protein [uncultured Flavonifractor sp.]
MNNLFSAVLPALFQAVLVMSLTAAATALAVLLIRAVMRILEVPRAIVFLLWAVVLFRMVCPVSFSSSWSLLSLFPAAEEQVADFSDGDLSGNQVIWDSPQSHERYQAGVSGGGIVVSPAPEDGGGSYVVTGPDGASPPATVETGVLPVLSVIWVLGVLALWLWSLLSWLRLRLKLSAAVRTPDGAWESDRVDSPFVLGFFPPKIYLPLGLTGDTRRYVLLHERSHIRRGDHIVKVLAFLALAVHWFNPLLWVSWFLSCRDMEAACDEAVLRRSPEDIRKNYSAALLSLAVAHPLRVPLAFGENDVKGRVKGALRWKRPAAALVAVALVALLASCYMLAANPAQVPETAPELTVTVEGSSATLSPETGVLDWDSVPLLTGSVAPSVELSFSDTPPDNLDVEDLLLSAQDTPAQSLDVSLDTDGSAAFALPSHEASTGTGTELRGIRLIARWGSGAQTLTVRYTFRVRLPATQIGVERDTPAVVVDGQELSLRNSSPFASLQNTQPLILTHRDALIALSNPTDAVGYTVELYALDGSTYTETGDPLCQMGAQSTAGDASLSSGVAFYLPEDVPDGLLGLRLRYQYPSGVTKSWIGLLGLGDDAFSETFTAQTEPLPAELTAADLPDPDNLYIDGVKRSFDDPQVWETYPIRILADLPETDITLYGFNETVAGRSGMLLRQGEQVAYYPHLTYNTGPQILPATLALADYDGDGAEELAAVVSDGTGTGVSTWDLHIFQLQNSDFGQVASFSWEDLGQAVNDQLDSSARREGDKALLTITWPKGQTECDITDLTDPSEDLSGIKAAAGWINSFDLSNLPIRATCELMVRNTLGYAASYSAQLSFDGSAFRLDPGSSTLTLYPSVLPDTPVTTWAEDTGNYVIENTPTRSEILSEYGFDWGDMYYVYCTPQDGTLQLQLWFDPETGKGCGFRYVWEGADGPLAVPDIYAFGFHGVTAPTEWDDPYICGLLGNADAYSVLTPWGTDGSEAVSDFQSAYFCRNGDNLEPLPANWAEGERKPDLFKATGTDANGESVNVLDITFSYWDDGSLLRKAYHHNTAFFGSTYFCTYMYYGSNECLSHAAAYTTSGSLEFFYLYDGDSVSPTFCLMLNNNGGFSFPTMFRY